MNKSLVLLSGGIDSVTLADVEFASGRLAAVVFVDMAHPAQIKEGWRAFAYHGSRRVPLKAIHVFGMDLGDMSDAVGASVVPSRNMVLLAVAQNVAAQLGADHILIGATADDAAHYPDCRAESIELASQAFVAMGGVPVIAPFVAMTKAQVVSLAKSMGLSESDAWSCYRGDEEPCGFCASCLEARKAWDTPFHDDSTGWVG